MPRLPSKPKERRSKLRGPRLKKAGLKKAWKWRPRYNIKKAPKLKGKKKLKRPTLGFKVAGAKDSGCGPVSEKTCRDTYYKEYNHPIKGNWFTTPCENDPQGRTVGAIAQEDFEEQCENDPKFEQYACHFKSEEHLKKSKNVKKLMFASYYQTAMAALQEAIALCKTGSAADFLEEGDGGGPGKAKASRLGRKAAAKENKVLRGVSTFLKALNRKILNKEASSVKARFSKEAMTAERRALYNKIQQKTTNRLVASRGVSAEERRGGKLIDAYIKSQAKLTKESGAKQIRAAAIAGTPSPGKFYQGGAVAPELGGSKMRQVGTVTRKGPTPSNIEKAIAETGAGAQLGKVAEANIVKAAGPLGGLVERAGVGKVIEKETNKALSSITNGLVEKIGQNAAFEAAVSKYSKEFRKAAAFAEKAQGLYNKVSKIGDDVAKITGASKGGLGFAAINAVIGGASGGDVLGIAKSAVVGYLAIANPVVAAIFDISIGLDVVNHVVIPLLEKATGANLSPVSKVTQSASSVIDTVLF